MLEFIKKLLHVVGVACVQDRTYINSVEFLYVHALDRALVKVTTPDQAVRYRVISIRGMAELQARIEVLQIEAWKAWAERTELHQLAFAAQKGGELRKQFIWNKPVQKDLDTFFGIVLAAMREKADNFQGVTLEGACEQVEEFVSSPLRAAAMRQGS